MTRFTPVLILPFLFALPGAASAQDECLGYELLVAPVEVANEYPVQCRQIVVDDHGAGYLARIADTSPLSPDQARTVARIAFYSAYTSNLKQQACATLRGRGQHAEAMRTRLVKDETCKP